MDAYRKRFWDTFEQMQEDFDRFFEHYSRAKHPSVVAFRTRWSPPANVSDTGDSVCVLVEIAGMSREGLDLIVEEDRLTLRGTREQPAEAMKGCYQQMEIAFGEFEIDIQLPAPVDAEGARACYRDGFLAVQLPKIPQAKPIRMSLSVADE